MFMLLFKVLKVPAKIPNRQYHKRSPNKHALNVFHPTLIWTKIFFWKLWMAFSLRMLKSQLQKNRQAP